MSIPENVVLFHCALPVLNEDGEMITKANGGVLKQTPTHTLAFSRLNESTLIMGWAATHELDSYNKKVGREIALERITHLETRLADCPDRGITEVDGIEAYTIPNVILESNFDFYVNNAVKSLLDVEEGDSVTLLYRSCDVDNPVCSVTIDLTAVEDEVDEEIAGEKVDTDATSEYIFASYVNDEDEVIVYVQNRAEYGMNGYSDDVNDDMVAILGPVVNNEGFVIVDQHKPILCHEEASEIDVVRALKANGLAYSSDLEEAVLAM